MRIRYLAAALTFAIAGALLVTNPSAQGRGAVASGLFTALDANKDSVVTKDEWTSAFAAWFSKWDAAKTGSVSQELLSQGLAGVMPPPAPPSGTPPPQNQTPNPADVEKMMAALPDRAPAKPKQPRRVLVLAKAAGFVHSSIPLAARTVEEIGKKTGAWSTTITYDAADINEQNLKQYDAIFLASTTGHFLDDPKDAAATAARRKALIDFVRNGKGVAGIHAASDSYHQSRPAPASDQPAGGGGPGRGQGRGNATTAPLALAMLAQGDQNSDRNLSRAELTTLADAWWAKIDTDNSGRVTQQDFPKRFAAVMPPPPPAALGPTGFPIQQRATQLGPDRETGTWPEWNQMIGGFFKFHWNDGTVITVKLDEPKHPLNAPFKGQEFTVMDEIYTFGRETYSRANLRVLTSINYDKMSAEDKAKEQYPRPDGDYALSWIRRDGKGRVFYEALGHSERVYAIKPILEHVLAGIQYVLGDLQVDDAPSAKGGTK